MEKTNRGEKSEEVRKMEKSSKTDKEARMLARWDRFCAVQSGVYPSKIAAIRLGITSAGLFQASERGWISFFQIGRDRWYSRKDVARYAEHRAHRKNMGAIRASAPKNCTDDDDGGEFRNHTFREL